MSLMVSRRWFIGGAASFGALAGRRVFAASGFASGKANLVFGVVSDIHIACHSRPGYSEADAANELTFLRTLEWFRDMGVDGVVIAGDMADHGLIRQLGYVAEAWNRVFPGDRAPDGRRVEKLFVYGNHDFGGVPYARRLPNNKKCDEDLVALVKDGSDAEVAAETIYNDPKTVWEKTFNEPFEPIWTKVVKGYRFVGAHWWSSRGCKGADEKFNEGVKDWYATYAKAMDPSLPFFHIQHPHPADTCYGSWAWGRDNGGSTKALSAFPNAIAFSGHSHYPLTDERSVWQGAFTSVGTSSLRYSAACHEEFPEGLENTKGNRAADAAKLLPCFSRPSDCRQGMLWRVYGDRIVVERRDMVNGFALGEDWVLPLPAAEPKPFAFAERAKKIGAPEFPAGAEIVTRRSKRKTRGAPEVKDKAPAIASVEKECVDVVIPAAVAKDGARAYQFEVTANSADGASVFKRILPEGFNHGVRHKRTVGETVCPFALDELPKGAVRFTVKPLNCFGRAGSPLVSGEVQV